MRTNMRPKEKKMHYYVVSLFLTLNYLLFLETSEENMLNSLIALWQISLASIFKFQNKCFFFSCASEPEEGWKLSNTHGLCKPCSQALLRGILSGLYLDHKMSRAWRQLEISQVTFSHCILYHKMHKNTHTHNEHSEDGESQMLICSRPPPPFKELNHLCHYNKCIQAEYKT